MAYNSSNLLGTSPAQAALNNTQQQGLNPVQQQRLRALGAVRAGNAPTIQSYAQAHPVSTMPSAIASAQPSPLVSKVTMRTPLATSNLGDAPQGILNPNYNAGAVSGAPGSLDPTLGQPQPQAQQQGISPSTGTQSPYSATNPPATFPGLIGAQLGQAQGYYNQQQGLTTQSQELQKQMAATEAQFGQAEAAATGQFGGASGVTASDTAGRIAQLEGIKQSTLANMQQQVAAIEAEQAKQAGYQAPITSLGQTAIGATAPQLGAPGQQYYQPLQAGAGGATSSSGNVPSTLNPLNNLSNIAQQVVDGRLSLSDAQNLGGSVANWGGALNQAIQKIKPNFNFAQASALGTTQGQVAPQLQMAQTALNNLQNVFANIPKWQTTGIPALNSLSNLFSGLTGVGLKSETEKQNAIKEARTQVANALGTMTNSTPTAWTATVQSWFPDSATPAQVQAGIQQFTVLAQNRQQIYGSPGEVQPFTGTANQNASLYSF